MTIRINQIAVDFTLETERTFAELTVALKAWAHGQHLAILGILADGKALGPEDQSLLDSIGEIEVEAVPAGERDLARVAVIARFFSLLSHGWEHQDQSLISELHKEFASVREALFPLFSPLAPRLLAPLSVLDGPWTNQEALQEAARKLALEAECLRRELQDPFAALSETLETLDFSLVQLEALGGLFQKGFDRDGFNLILHLFTVFDDLGRRSGLVRKISGRDGQEWTDFTSELQPFLKEAEAALASGDYILLTDLLEYEVTPRLKNARNLFPETQNLDPVRGVL